MIFVLIGLATYWAAGVVVLSLVWTRDWDLTAGDLAMITLIGWIGWPLITLLELLDHRRDGRWRIVMRRRS